MENKVKEDFLLQVEFQLRLNGWKQKVTEWEKEVMKSLENY